MFRLTLSYDITFLAIAIFIGLFIRHLIRNPERVENMKRLMEQTKTKFNQLSFDGNNDHQQQQQQQHPLQPSPPSNSTQSIQPPTYKDVIRYRYHHGTNLGSIFVLEKWLTGCMFVDGANGTSELAAVEAMIKKDGKDKTRERFEKHWREYISDSDLDWLRDVARCTTVRLPIGYFTLGPGYCDGTPFERVADVYKHAWEAVKGLVKRCGDRGLGVLIDLHALPGGANTGDHSGTDSHKAELWGSKKWKDLATKCACFVVKEVKGMDNVAGVQIVNEADSGSEGMYDWYESVLSEVSKVDLTMPIYISDAWDLAKCIPWTQSKNVPGRQCNPVVIDTHLYWCFTDADQQKSPQQITDEVATKLNALDGRDGSVIDRGAAQAVIGEYSCVLGESSWKKAGNASREDLIRKFGNAQSHRFQERTGGSFFWTYKMDWMDGGEWGFRQQVNARSVMPTSLLASSANDGQSRVHTAQTQQDQKKQATVSQHCKYWDSQHPGQYEHWRFGQGWELGFTDTVAFFGVRTSQKSCGSHLQGCDKIGMLDLWVLKRLRESGQTGNFVWEFEQGLRQGVQDFNRLVGVE